MGELVCVTAADGGVRGVPGVGELLCCVARKEEDGGGGGVGFVVVGGSSRMQ